MEPSTTSNKSNGEILSRSDHDESLINFTRTVLNLENSSNSVSSGDSAILSSPERDLWQSQSCSEKTKLMIGLKEFSTKPTLPLV